MYDILCAYDVCVYHISYVCGPMISHTNRTYVAFFYIEREMLFLSLRYTTTYTYIIIMQYAHTYRRKMHCS